MIRLRHLVTALLLCLIAALVALGVVGEEQKYARPVSPNGPVAVAGVTYQVEGARPLDEVGDGAVLRALPAGLRRPSHEDLLYGVFIAATNSGDRTQPLARRFALVDAKFRSFAPLQLAPASAFRYRPSRLRPGGRTPANASPPAEDIAEQGSALVFRIPRAVYRHQVLTLRVFDPTGRTPPADILV